MNNKPTAYLKRKFYVPASTVSMTEIKDKYTIRLYNETVCQRCSYYEERHCYVCDACPLSSYKGTAILYDTKIFKGVKYVGLPVGDRMDYGRAFGISVSDYRLKDLRTKTDFEYPIKFTGSLRNYQAPLVETFIKYNFGIIEAPPRTGKTVVAVAISAHLKKKTIILAKQIEFLHHFEKHFREFTNIEKFEKKTGKKLVGIPKNEAECAQFQISLFSYQKFISEKGKKFLRKVHKNWGTVIVDEAHGVAAECFSKVVSYIPAKYKLGLTATPERKDGLHFITRSIIGPVVSMSNRESLVPTVYVHETQIKNKHEYKIWQYAMRFLAKNEKRNELIVDQVCKDLEEGHSIVIPVTFKYHVADLVDRINYQYGEDVAVSFTGGAKEKKKRDEVLQKACDREVLVVVGIRSLIQLGLNVPAWSAIYEIIPISKKPNLKQETSRIRTPDPNKKNPIIRYFVDQEVGASLGCFRNSFRHMMEFGYNIDEKNKAFAYALMGKKKDQVVQKDIPVGKRF